MKESKIALITCKWSTMSNQEDLEDVATRARRLCELWSSCHLSETGQHFPGVYRPVLVSVSSNLAHFTLMLLCCWCFEHRGRRDIPVCFKEQITQHLQAPGLSQAPWSLLVPSVVLSWDSLYRSARISVLHCNYKTVTPMSHLLRWSVHTEGHFANTPERLSFIVFAPRNLHLLRSRRQILHHVVSFTICVG